MSSRLFFKTLISKGFASIPAKRATQGFSVPSPLRERVRVRGHFPYSVWFDHLDLLNGTWRLQPARSMAARGQSLLPIAAKVTKSACPCTPLHPAVLATGGRPWTPHGRDAYASPIVRCSAATTARCSAPRRGLKGRMEPIFDRFAMRTTTPRMRISGLRQLAKKNVATL